MPAGRGASGEVVEASAAAQTGQQAGAAPAYAALDLGTNNCRMLIAAPAPNGFRIIESVSRPVALGGDLQRRGRLSPAAAARILRAMDLCAERLRRHGVRRRKLVATHACRQAANAAAVLDEVRRRTGLKLQVIRPELEARLALTSCAPLVDPVAEQLLVFDIGGGSTELIWIDLARVPAPLRRRAVLELAPLHGRLDPESPLGARIVDWISVPLGVATLHQAFEDVTCDRARFALMSCHFEDLVQGFAPVAPGFSHRGALQMIGTSGTVTTIAAAHLGLSRYSRDRVDGTWLGTGDVERVIARLLRLPPDRRARHPAIGAQRARLIVSGAAILQTFLRLWPVARLRVADRGLREGLLYAMMHEDGHFPAGIG
ncbi:MAG: exopolyphosphatase [Paracoccaceae bacterium]|nr:MAG: exopolyphosphatase [Paracoccaceae bacterium]